MFTPGTVKILLVLPHDDDLIDYVEYIHPDYKREDDKQWAIGARLFELPHQCDSWFIGSSDDVRALIKELEESLRKIGE